MLVPTAGGPLERPDVRSVLQAVESFPVSEGPLVHQGTGTTPLISKGCSGIRRLAPRLQDPHLHVRRRCADSTPAVEGSRFRSCQPDA